MAKYRKKPVIIEAEQFRLSNKKGWPEEVEPFEARRRFRPWTCKHCNKPDSSHGYIDTLEGGHIVCDGDWIITGVKGEKYPCKPDIFEMTYELVEDVKAKCKHCGQVVDEELGFVICHSCGEYLCTICGRQKICPVCKEETDLY